MSDVPLVTGSQQKGLVSGGLFVVIVDLAVFYFCEILICVYMAEPELVDLTRLVDSRDLSLPPQCWT